MAAKQQAADLKNIYQIKVTLRGSRPPIWRRIAVAGDTTLAKLHMILQVVMGWEDSHLHQFIVGKTYYSEPDPDGAAIGFVTKNEKKVKLAQLGLKEKSKFIYEYDFGDSWEHDLLVEKIMPPEEGKQYPVCLKGKRACPPEDCGGVWGYAGLLEILADPKHPEYEDMMEWMEEDFDPEAFNLEGVNAYLQVIR